MHVLSRLRIRLPRPRLRWRIIAWSFFPTAIILAAVALVFYGAYQQVTEDLVLVRDRELARLSANQVTAALEHYVDLLSWVARSPDLTAQDPPLCHVALQQARSRLAAFDAGAVLVDAEGNLVATTTPVEAPGSPSGTSWAGRSYVLVPLETGRPYISNVVPDGPDGEEVVVVAVPVSTYEGGHVGVLAGMLRVAPDAGGSLYGGLAQGALRRSNVPEDLYYVDEQGYLRQPSVGEAGISRILLQPRLVRLQVGSDSVFLVDGQGRVVYHSDPTYVGVDLSARPSVQRALRRNVGAERLPGGDGGDVVASYAPVPDTEWAYVSEIRWSVLAGSVDTYGRFLLGLLVLGLLVPALVVQLGVRRLTHPIAQLSRAAEQVAAGTYGTCVSVRTGDELEDLAERFNEMSSQLEASYAELERRVAGRTRELETLNAVAVSTSRTLDLRSVLDDALRQALRFTHMQRGEAYEVGEGGGLRLVVASTLEGEAHGAGSGIPLDGGAAAEAALTSGEPVILPGDGATTARDGGPEKSLCVGVPLMAHGRPVGVLVLGDRAAQPPSPEEVALLAAIGHQVGVAVENARLYARAEESAVSAERSRLARDLHDSVTQTLYGMTLYAKAASRLLAEGDGARAAGYLDDVEVAAQQVLQEMRLLIYQLRPPVLQEEGLANALRYRLDAVEARSGLATSFSLTGSPCPPPEVEEALYRVAQEALNNTLKHARATRVEVCLAGTPEGVTLELRDDGRGFDPASPPSVAGVGLEGMRERLARLGGVLMIESAPGAGTIVRAQVPG